MAHGWRARGIAALILVTGFGRLACAGSAVQDEVWGDNFDGFDTTTCDSGLAANSNTGTDYAKALDLCATTTDAGTGWGVISATLTQADGTSADAAVSHSIRTSFGSGNTPLAGASLAVLSTGVAAASGQAGFVAFDPGDDTGTSSNAPSDWLTANGNQFPNAPGCPHSVNTTAYNSEMLTLRIRVPNNARSFSFGANFLSSEFPEWVCSPYNDMFVVLLDSTFAGTPANPADKNLAMYFPPLGQPVPVGVNLAYGNIGLFAQCVNGATGCASSSAVPGTINTCVGTSGLLGTGMDTPDPGVCDSNSLLGGGTGWLVMRGNVVPGEVITLRIAIWDVGDWSLDSLALLDSFQWSYSTITPGTTLN